MSSLVLTHDLEQLSLETDRRFRRVVALVFVPTLAFGIAAQLIKITTDLLKPETVQEDRVARLLEELKQPPPVELAKPKVEEVSSGPDTETPKDSPTKKPKPTAEEAAIAAQASKDAATQRARQRASKEIAKAFGGMSGLLTSPVGAGAPSALSRGEGTSNRAGDGGTSDIFIKDATATSGGIGKGGSLARGGGSTELSGRATKDVSGPSGVGRGGGGGGSGKGGRGPARNLEEIQLVFDRNNSALSSLYNRARRDKPGMQGKMVIRLTIEPDGSVSACTLVSSELGNPELERKILARIQLFNFGAKAVPSYTYPNYPIIFLPS